MVEKYASENDVTKETAVRDLMYHEELRDTFRKIQEKMSRQKSQQMIEVWLQAGDEKIVFDTSDEVEAHILQRNKSHLQQAYDTPFAGGAMAEYLDKHGDSDFANRVLEGEFLHEVQDGDPVMKAYLETLQYPRANSENSVDTNITLQQYKEFWKNKRETTVTSPYGLHIGHYKSVLNEEDILELHLELMTLPFKYSFAPKRWCKTVQVMLEKNPGSPWSHRLRIIELFDAQLNAAMQMVFGKRMVHNAVDNETIHPSAFGSVPGRNAQDALLEKLISYDMLRIERKNGAIFDCDAKGCYDRILPGFSTLHTRRLGMPTNWAKFFSIFWRKCTHHIRTKFGISEKSFAMEENELLHGIGQGNGAGPALWLSHLIVMFDTIQKTAKAGSSLHQTKK